MPNIIWALIRDDVSEGLIVDVQDEAGIERIDLAEFFSEPGNILLAVRFEARWRKNRLEERALSVDVTAIGIGNKAYRGLSELRVVFQAVGE